jgi:DNA polymerase-3 subunit delta
MDHNGWVKIPFEQLPGELSRKFAPAFLVSGDETLLVSEAADAIRAAARRVGCEERSVHTIERGTGWDSVRSAAASLSLFCARRLLEIRIPTGKPGPEGARVLQELAERADESFVLLVITGRLEREAQSSGWLKAVDRRGVVVTVWAVGLEKLPSWLGARARRLGLEIEPAALALIAERTEGNLLAANQELEKLQLLAPGGRVTAQMVLGDVASSARFSIYKLGQALSAHDATRTLRILDGLRAEGAELPLILWSVLRALRSDSRPPQPRFIERAARADRMAKGQMTGDAWDELALLAADFCGRRALPIPRVLK